METGRFPLEINRKISILKYWCNIIESDNCITKAIYDVLLDKTNSNVPNENWASLVKNELYNIGLGHYWNSQSVPNNKLFTLEVKTRLKDIFIQSCRANMEASSKCILYKNIVDSFCLQYYLRKSIPTKLKYQLCKFRISSHNLLIETGRYTNVTRNERRCQLCDHGEIEDEYHFILCCPFYIDIRLKFIKPYYYRRPSMLKLVQLLSSTSVKRLTNLAKYLQSACKRRDIVI